MQKMIKILALTVTAGAIAIAAHAQPGDGRPHGQKWGTFMPDGREKLAVGLKAGANYSGVYRASGTFFQPKGKFGFVGGAFVGIPFSKLLGVQPEVLYSQKGFKATGYVSSAQYDIVRTTTYIDVPIFAAVKPSKYITILAGPQYSYLLQQKDVFTYPVVGVEPLHNALSGNLRKSMFAVAAGVDASSTHMVLSLRGGLDLQYNTESSTVITPRYKNKWVQLTVGYRF